MSTMHLEQPIGLVRHSRGDQNLSPLVAGFLLEKELTYSDGAVASPKCHAGSPKEFSKIGVSLY